MTVATRRRSVTAMQLNGQLAADTDAPVTSSRKAVPSVASEAARRQRLRAEDAGLLLTMLLFTLAWLLALASGVAQHTGRHPDNKVDLPLAWFDTLVRIFGPLLPLPVLAMRWYASVLPSRVRELGVLYSVLSGLRIVLYIIHSTVHWAVAVEVGKHPHLISDHIFLGSSLIAVLSAEGHMLLKDMRDPGWPQRRGHTRTLIVCAWWLCVYLTALLCLEMRITAIFFHRPQETVLAALGGLLVFQLPTTAWLFLQRNTLLLGAGAVPAEVAVPHGSRRVGDA